MKKIIVFLAILIFHSEKLLPSNNDLWTGLALLATTAVAHQYSQDICQFFQLSYSEKKYFMDSKSFTKSLNSKSDLLEGSQGVVASELQSLVNPVKKDQKLDEDLLLQDSVSSKSTSSRSTQVASFTDLLHTDDKSINSPQNSVDTPNILDGDQACYASLGNTPQNSRGNSPALFVPKIERSYFHVSTPSPTNNK